MQASNNLTDDAKMILLSQHRREGTLKAPTSNGKVSSIKLTPDIYEGEDGIAVREAIIKTQDDLLVYVVVLVAPETFNEDKDECITIAEYLIDSISEGERMIERSQHIGFIEWSGLDILLKQDYVLTLQRGVDFDVYYIQKIVKPGELRPYMGIYFGGHPSFSSEGNQVTVDGKILGQSIKWYFNKEIKPIDSDTIVETLMGTNDGGYPLYMHIFVSPQTESYWNELKQMAESLAIKK
jgi:hypothetical protein